MLRTAFLVLAVLALAACGGDERAAPETSAGGGEQAAAPRDGIRELDNVLDLRADFAADSGKPRLLLLFSPT